MRNPKRKFWYARNRMKFCMDTGFLVCAQGGDLTLKEFGQLLYPAPQGRYHGKLSKEVYMKAVKEFMFGGNLWIDFADDIYIPRTRTFNPFADDEQQKKDDVTRAHEAEQHYQKALAKAQAEESK